MIDRSLISIVSARWSNSPHSKGINECSAENISTTRHFPWRRCSWPAHSPDLSACDYFLWGYLKSRVFISKPRTIAELKQSIKEKVAATPEQMTRQVMENLGLRLKQCLRNGGRHLSDVLFKTQNGMH